MIENNPPTHVLIVDDEPDIELLMNQRFRKQLREKKFTFSFANNGVQAMEILAKTNDIRLVISDINMPEMDGLTLLKNVNQKFPHVIPIIVSAYGDMNNIRTAMNLGAFDFVTKPINFEDLTVTIDKTLTHIKQLVHAQITQSRLDSILHELNIASEIQQSIIPKVFIHDNNIELFAKMIAAKEVGGDFYDFFWVDKEKTQLALVIADVSGKGVPAALFMTVARTLLRAHAYNHPSPAECLTIVNNALQTDNTNIMFVTMFYGILDVHTGILTYTNAGHNPAHFIRKDGQIETLHTIHGMALGVIENIIYRQDQIKMNQGDLLFLYTDGVTEAERFDGSFYTDLKLITTLESHRDLAASELVNTIRTDISAFAGGWPQSDDITMLAIRYLAGNKTENGCTTHDNFSTFNVAFF